MYFLKLPLLVHKIFTLYINGVLNCKCPAPGRNGEGCVVLHLYRFTYLHGLHRDNCTSVACVICTVYYELRRHNLTAAYTIRCDTLWSATGR